MKWASHRTEHGSPASSHGSRIRRRSCHRRPARNQMVCGAWISGMVPVRPPIQDRPVSVVAEGPPRSREEQRVKQCGLWPSSGPSQRARGAAAGHADVGVGRGTIPAHAESRTPPSKSSCMSWDHPRSCGEQGRGLRARWLGTIPARASISEASAPGAGWQPGLGVRDLSVGAFTHRLGPADGDPGGAYAGPGGNVGRSLRCRAT